MKKKPEIEPAMLVVIRGKNKGAIYKLGARNLTGGRDAGNLIQIIDPGISRRHFLIRTTPQGYMISDLQSANGTHVNEEQVQASYIKIGDVIRVGNTSLRMDETVDAAPDAVLGERVTDKGLSAVPTEAAQNPLTADLTEAMAPEALDPFGDESEESEPLPSLVHEPVLPCLAQAKVVECGVPSLIQSTEDPQPPHSPPAQDPEPSSQPEVVDTEALSEECTSEIDLALEEMGRMGQYLDMAIHIISQSVCPDRAVVLKVGAQGALISRKVYLRPELGQESAKIPPAIHLVTRAIKTREPVLDNRLEAQAGEVFPATALVTPVISAGTSLGVLYVDSFAGTHKMFVELDISVMQKVAAVLAKRWRAK